MRRTSEETLKKLTMISVISSNNIEHFDRLLSKGYDPNENLYGSRPIHEVCRYDYLQFLQYLLKAGAELNAEDGLGRTPVMICVEHGNLNCLQHIMQLDPLLDSRILESAYNCLNDDTSEVVCSYVKNEIIPLINWVKRKGFVFAYKYNDNPKLPLCLIIEISRYL